MPLSPRMVLLNTCEALSSPSWLWLDPGHLYLNQMITNTTGLLSSNPPVPHTQGYLCTQIWICHSLICCNSQDKIQTPGIQCPGNLVLAHPSSFTLCLLLSQVGPPNALLCDGVLFGQDPLYPLYLLSAFWQPFSKVLRSSRSTFWAPCASHGSSAGYTDPSLPSDCRLSGLPLTTEPPSKIANVC